MFTSWYEQLEEEGLDFTKPYHCTLTLDELMKEFENGYGGIQGRAFTAWDSERVYFPWVCFGVEGVASVLRNPCDEATVHIGCN